MNENRVIKAVLNVAKELAKLGISKARRNENGRYNFRGIDDVINALAPLYAANSIVVLPEVLERTCEERASKSGSPLFYVTVKTKFRIVCAEDNSEIVVGPFYGEAMDSSDKATNKAMSAAYKYFAFQTFAIPTEADDADAESHEPAPRKRPTPAERESWIDGEETAPAPAAITDCRNAGELRLWVENEIPKVSGDDKDAKRAWLNGVIDVAGRLGVSRETVFAWCQGISRNRAA